MQDLRIVGLDEQNDPPRLMLSDEAGAEFALPVDQALRAAVERTSDATGPAARSGSVPAPAALSPREIQARLRGGATVEQVVSASGQSREHVLRYAGPVADERAYIASRARQTVVASASPAELHRTAFGDSPAQLEAMVKVRLRAIDVPLETLSWDAWRREDGRWNVICSFDISASSTHAQGIGQKPPAQWLFDASTRTLQAQNEWAESLSSLHAATSVTDQRTGRRLAAVDEPFDVDRSTSRARSFNSRGSVSGTPPVKQSEEPAAEESGGRGTETEDLLDILRARRGQRLGSDETGDDKLATLLTRDEQPRSPAGQEPSAEGSASPRRPVRGGSESPRHRAADGHMKDAGADSQHTGPLPGLEELSPAEPEPSGTDAWGFSYEDSADEPENEASTNTSSDLQGPAAQGPAAQRPHRGSRQDRGTTERKDAEPRDSVRGGSPEDSAGSHQGDEAESKNARRSSSKPRRPSMPRWDDILFGSKND